MLCSATADAADKCRAILLRLVPAVSSCVSRAICAHLVYSAAAEAIASGPGRELVISSTGGDISITGQKLSVFVLGLIIQGCTILPSPASPVQNVSPKLPS